MKLINIPAGAENIVLPDQTYSVKQEMIHPVPSHYILNGLRKTIGHYKVLWFPDRNPNPKTPEIKAVSLINFYILHPPADIWIRQLYSWLISPIVKHRIAET